MSQDSIVAKKIIKYHVISNKLTPESVQITKNDFVLLALHDKYMEMNQLKTRKPRIKSVSKIRNILLDEIKEVMTKRDELQKTCKSLEAKYVASVTLAEKEMNMSHVMKANTLKRRCVEIESEVTKLDDTVLLLEEKKRKLK